MYIYSFFVDIGGFEVIYLSFDYCSWDVILIRIKEWK